MGVAVCGAPRGDLQAVAMAVEGDDHRDLPVLPRCSLRPVMTKVWSCSICSWTSHIFTAHPLINLIWTGSYVRGGHKPNYINLAKINKNEPFRLDKIRHWRWWSMCWKETVSGLGASEGKRLSVQSECSCPGFFIFFYKMHCLPWPDEYLIGICCFICMLYNLGSYNRNCGGEAAVPAVLSPTLTGSFRFPHKGAKGRKDLWVKGYFLWCLFWQKSSPRTFSDALN